MIENEIRALLDSPADGDDAPSLANLEDALTAGYARAMALEADQWRLQRRIADMAVDLVDDEQKIRPQELRTLARELKSADADLVTLRALLGCLRARANLVRAA
jgi:hypothetical protein